VYLRSSVYVNNKVDFTKMFKKFIVKKVNNFKFYTEHAVGVANSIIFYVDIIYSHLSIDSKYNKKPQKPKTRVKCYCHYVFLRFCFVVAISFSLHAMLPLLANKGEYISLYNAVQLHTIREKKLK